MQCKELIAKRINEILDPMRDCRTIYRSNPSVIDEILLAGTERARNIAKETMHEVREAMGIKYFKTLLG